MDTATELLEEAADIVRQRGTERDLPDGERAMACTAQAFNALTDRNLTEKEGWIFMLCLKLSRAKGGSFKKDDFMDTIGYTSLLAECAIREEGKKNGFEERSQTAPRPYAPYGVTNAYESFHDKVVREG